MKNETEIKKLIEIYAHDYRDMAMSVFDLEKMLHEFSEEIIARTI